MVVGCLGPRFLNPHLLDTDGKLGGDLLDRARNLSNELCLRWEVLHLSQLLAVLRGITLEA